MKKLIQKIREKKGFTLAELLIVVAIIAVLVAIAIPIFTTQLERSRDSVSISNLRGAYAEAAAAYLSADGKAYSSGNVNIAAGSNDVVVSNVIFKGTQAGWANDMDDELDGFTHTTLTDALGGTPGTYTCTFTFNDNGTCTLSDIS